MEHQLTLQEMNKLVEEYKALDYWEQARKLALDICGEKAYKVVVETELQDADELHRVPAYVAIYDRDDNLLWSEGSQEYLRLYDTEPYIVDLPIEELEEFAEPPDEESKVIDIAELDDGAIPEMPEDYPATDAHLYEHEECEDENYVSWDENTYAEVISYLTAVDQQALQEVLESVAEPVPVYTTFPPADACYILDMPPLLSFPPVYLKEGTYKHILSKEEFFTLAALHTEFATWNKVHQIIRATYGQKACFVVIKTYAEFDDEGGYRSPATLENIYDKDWNIVPPDFSLPAWSEDNMKSVLSLYRGSSDAARSRMYWILKKADALNPGTYNLETPPAIPPQIYTNVEESATTEHCVPRDMKRLLTPREINKLAQEYIKVERWEQVRKQALALCGEKAHKVVVAMRGEGYREIRRVASYVRILDKHDNLIWSLGTPEGEEWPHDMLSSFEEEGGVQSDDTAFTTIDVINKGCEPYEPWDESLYTEVVTYLNELDREESERQDTELNSGSDDLSLLALFPPVDATYMLDDPPERSFSHVYLKENETYQRIESGEEIVRFDNMYQTLHDWNCAERVIHLTYGPEAAIVVIKSFAEYMDEGYYPITMLGKVYDREGNVLVPNLELPVWRAKRTLKHLSYYRDNSDAAYHIIQEMLQADGAIKPLTYDLDNPPPIPPKLYTDVTEQKYKGRTIYEPLN